MVKGAKAKTTSNKDSTPPSPSSDTVEILDSSSSKTVASPSKQIETPNKSTGSSQFTARIHGDESSGSSSLATSMALANNKDVSTGKRERVEQKEDTFKQQVQEAYQTLFGDSLADNLSGEECFSILANATSAPYSDHSEFKNRMAFLEAIFRKEVDAPIPDKFGGSDIKSKGYSLLLAQSAIISKVCQTLRTNDSFDLVKLLNGLEFINNIADLNMSSIKLGIKNGFEASQEFVDGFRSGGSIDDITSKQQEKAIKKAEKTKSQETLAKLS